MTKSPKSILLFACALCAASLAACDREKDRQPEPKAAMPAPTADTALSQPMPGSMPSEASSKPAGASAQLKPASGSQVSGTVTFSETNDGVSVMAEVNGLTPGKHGFHVHQNGDCSAPDAASAGEHFNPDAKQHGSHDSEMRHRGDLGNLDAGSDGRASTDETVKGITLSGPDSIVGKAVLVHASEDDLKTPPSGNSGARIACGVIETAGAMAAPR